LQISSRLEEKKESGFSLSPFQSATNFFADVGIFGVANLISLLSGIVQTFIVPKYLPVEDYGYWRLFLLYAGYVGFLHLGFVDGIFIGWLGKKTGEVEQEVGYALRVFIFQQLIVIGFALLIISTIRILADHFVNPVFYFIVVSVLILAFFTNLFALISFAFQVMRQFKLLSLLTIFQAVGFLIGILFLFLAGVFSYHHLIIWRIIIMGLVLMCVEHFIRGWLKRPVLFPVSITNLISYCWKNIRLGWYVLLGNFISILFFSLDRLFTSSFFSMEEFAYYSLAASFLGIIYLFINTAGRVALPYLAGLSSEGAQKIYPFGCSAIIFLWGLGLGFFFPASGFIAWYLPHYLASLPVLKILLCSAGFGGVINIMHSNYYKSNKLVRPYFGLAATALVIFIGLIAVGLHFWRTPLTIAVATAISFGCWYLLNERKLARLSGQSGRRMMRELLVILGMIGAFLGSSLLPVMWQQMLVHYSLLAVFYLFFFRGELNPVFARLLALIR